MADLISMLAAVAGSGGGADPNFKQTVLLLHGDGTNGAQNNTFLDSSSNNFTITRNGNTTQGTFSPFSLSDGYWSNFFDGTNDRLTIADNAVLRPGTGNFTIEAWVYRAAAGAAHTIFAKGASTPTGFAFLITSSDTLRFTDTSTDITSTGTVAANTWVHVAVAREGTGSNQLKLYINGVQDGQGTVSTDFNQTEEARIGENRGATDDFNGYISNFRYVVGSAIYTAGFTPSTSPLTTTSQGAVSSEVELLTCQSNRFVDNSTNGFTVTPVNNIRVTPFSPFAPTAAYSAGTNGGSGYFDGAGDYLSAASNAAFALPGAFTFECWFYPITFDQTATRGDTIFTAITNGAFLFGRTSGGTGNLWGIAEAGVAWRLTTATLPTNMAWNHMVGVRDGSNNTALFLNGVRVASGTVTTSFTQSGFTIGSDNNQADSYLDGYLANVRLVKGTAVYDPTQTTLTVPTAQLTAISGTSLLCDFTNAGIIDNTGKNVLETVGNAQIDTAVKKYGTGSLEFDGNGDYLAAPASLNFDFGTADFTIECWAYIAANSAQDGDGNRVANLFVVSSGGNIAAIFGISGNSTTTGTGLFLFKFIGSSTNRSVATTITQGVWNHLAVCRNGTNLRFFVNGTQAGSTITDSTSWGSSAYPSYVGGNPNSASYLQYLNGFIDDLRITKGVARYTAAFTPPTAAFPNE